MKFCYRFKR